MKLMLNSKFHLNSFLLLFFIFFQTNESYSVCLSIVCRNPTIQVEQSYNGKQYQLFKANKDEAVKFNFTYQIQDLQTENQIQVSKLLDDEFFETEEAYRSFIISLNAAGMLDWSDENAYSFQDSLKYLHRVQPELTEKQKLAILSYLGSYLNNGYSQTTTNQSDLEAVFQNLKNYGNEGGICGDIHQYLTKVQQSLGFRDSMIVSTNWKRGNIKSDDGNGHFVSVFKNPQTGQFYIQNYSGIFATNKYSIVDAVDLVTRIYSPLMSVSNLSFDGEKFYNYVPEFTRYVFQSLNDLMNQDGNRIVQIQASQFQNQLKLAYRKQLKQARIGFHLIQDHYQINNQEYQIDLIGFDLKSQIEKKINRKFHALFSLVTQIQLGMVEVKIPQLLLNSIEETERTQRSAYLDLHLIGTARVNKNEGRVELHIQNPTMFQQNEIFLTGIGFKHEFNPMIAVDLRRMYEATWGSYNKQNLEMQVQDDRLALIIDTRSKNKKAYIEYEGGIYALEGVEAKSAQALRQKISLILDKSKIGKIEIIADLQKMISNPNNDIFYSYFENDEAKQISTRWLKSLNQNTEVGLKFNYKKNHFLPQFSEQADPLSFYQNKTSRKQIEVVFQLKLP